MPKQSTEPSAASRTQTRKTPYSYQKNDSDTPKQKNQKGPQIIRGYTELCLHKNFQTRPATVLECWPEKYIMQTLMKFHVPGGPWRPCCNGLIDPSNPLSGCVGTRVSGGDGTPLREAAFLAEHLAGKSASPVPRQCVACMLVMVKNQRSYHNRVATARFVSDPTRTIQPFKVDPAEWDPADLVFPANLDGLPNGIVAPFPDWNSKFACVLRANVHNHVA